MAYKKTRKSRVEEVTPADDDLVTAQGFISSWARTTQVARQHFARDYEYTDGNGKQWLAKDRAKLEKQGRPVIEINQVLPQVLLVAGIVLTPSHQQFYSEKIGVPAEVIPYGYNPAFGRDLHLERDVDVVFLGSLRDRRRSEIMQRFESDFTKLEIKFVIHDGSPERGLVFGEERTRLINRTKILLSIMRQPWDDLVFRMLLGTPNGAMVVSEPVQDQYPFQSGVHFASAEIDRIPETVKYYLEHEEERQRIVQSAQDVIFNQMTGSMMTGKMLAALDENLTEE